MNTQSTRASDGYALRGGIVHHDALRLPRLHPRHRPAFDGGLSFVSAVLLMVAGAVGTVACVEVVRLVWAAWGF